jgi:hypothetical protein
MLGAATSSHSQECVVHIFNTSHYQWGGLYKGITRWPIQASETESDHSVVQLATVALNSLDFKWRECDH